MAPGPVPMERQRADGATLAAIYVIALAVIPARLVIRGLPLSINPATLVALLMAVCWLWAHFTTTLGMAKGPNLARTSLFAYFVSVLASYCYGMYRYAPVDEVNLMDHSLVLITALVGMALLICDGVPTLVRLEFVLKAIVVGGTAVAFVGALQFVFDLDLTEYLQLPGLKFSADSSGFVFERADFRRVAGTTGNPIEFGVLCAMILPLSLHYGLRARTGGGTAWRWRFCSLLIAFGLLFSISRSAVLGVLVAGAVLFVGWPRARRVSAIIVSVVFLAVVRVAFPGLLGTLVGLFSNFSNDPSIQYRTHDYPVVDAEVAKSFWLGRGVGAFYAPKHIILDNQYLLTLVETGVVGFVALALLFLAGPFVAFRVLHRTADPQRRDLALSLMACVVVPAVGSITFDLLSFKTVSGLMFALLGAIGCLSRLTPRSDDVARPAVRPRADGPLASLIRSGRRTGATSRSDRTCRGTSGAVPSGSR